MPTLWCTVATPNRELYSGPANYVNVPGGKKGRFGVLPGHEMLVALNDPGVLIIWMDADGKDRLEYLLFDGIAQVFHDNVTVLGRFGVAVKDIDVKAVTEQADELRKQIEQLKADLKKEEEAASAKTPNPSDEGEGDLEYQAEDHDIDGAEPALVSLEVRLKWCELQLATAEARQKK